jgi:hypothetical protein
MALTGFFPEVISAALHGVDFLDPARTPGGCARENRIGMPGFVARPKRTSGLPQSYARASPLSPSRSILLVAFGCDKGAATDDAGISATDCFA